MNEFGTISSSKLLDEEETLVLDSFDVKVALEIGEIAKILGIKRMLPIAIEVRLGEWTVYHVSLTGSGPQNQGWLDRKARVVLLKQHSTLYERVNAEEKNVDWYEANNLSEELYAVHGGGIPIISKPDGFVGVLLISGLPQVDDHNFGVEVLRSYLLQKGS
jgi:uncharacterized protein (UPF0303 family)